MFCNTTPTEQICKTMVEDGKPMRQNHYTMVEDGKTKDQVQGLYIYPY